MAEYRQIHTRIWDDSWFQELSPEGKLLFIYLFSNGQTSICGIYELSLKTTAFHTGIDRATIDQLLTLFERDGKAYYRDGYVWVKNLRKYNETESGKVYARIVKDLDTVPDGELKEIYCEFHRIPYRYPIDTQPIPNPTRNGNGNGKRNGERNGDGDGDGNLSLDIEDTPSGPPPSDPPPPYPLPPEIELYREITGLIPDVMRQEQVVHDIQMIRVRMKHPPVDDLKEFLLKKYKEWCGSITADGKPYNPSNPRWLEWGITGYVPTQSKPRDRETGRSQVVRRPAWE